MLILAVAWSLLWMVYWYQDTAWTRVISLIPLAVTAAVTVLLCACPQHLRHIRWYAAVVLSLAFFAVCVPVAAFGAIFAMPVPALLVIACARYRQDNPLTKSRAAI